MEIVAPYVWKTLEELERGEIALCNFGAGPMLAMALGQEVRGRAIFGLLHEHPDYEFTILDEVDTSRRCLAYGASWKLALPLKGDIQLGNYTKYNAGDVVSIGGEHGIVFAYRRGIHHQPAVIGLNTDLPDNMHAPAVFSSWKIILPEPDPETGKPQVLFRHGDASA